MIEVNPIQLLKDTFPNLDDDDVHMLSQAARARTYPQGAIICREGEPGSTLYILGEGYADIIVHASDNHEILVDTIGPNTYFGEMAIFGETTRSATIRAQTPCYTLEIDQMDFLAIASSNPDLLRMLIRQVIGHLRRNDQAVIQELNIKNEALQKAYADLAQQEELRTRFIATISHELRTPLTSIKGFMGLINQGAIQGDSLKVSLKSITRNVDKMVGLTNNLLLLYEMHPATPAYAYINIADVLIEALNAARLGLNGETAGVTLDIAPDIPVIHADRRSLTLAVRALIENAFKFNPDKAPISIGAFCTAESEMAIIVKDSGIGVPVEAHQRIFEPFVRLETEGSTYLFPGLGVGLTIARFIVERHGGRIEIQSAPGEGSTFTIFLPLARPESEAGPLE